LTQLGFIRLSSNPAAVQLAVSPGKAASLLTEMTRDSFHIYFAELPAPSTYGAEFSRILGHNQVMDCYLATLARHHNAILLTFDAKLRHLDGVETLAGI
jgi:predicted nucleic acid-binding protein